MRVQTQAKIVLTKATSIRKRVGLVGFVGCHHNRSDFWGVALNIFFRGQGINGRAARILPKGQGHHGLWKKLRQPLTQVMSYDKCFCIRSNTLWKWENMRFGLDCRELISMRSIGLERTHFKPYNKSTSSISRCYISSLSFFFLFCGVSLRKLHNSWASIPKSGT